MSLVVILVKTINCIKGGVCVCNTIICLICCPSDITRAEEERLLVNFVSVAASLLHTRDHMDDN